MWMEREPDLELHSAPAGAMAWPVGLSHRLLSREEEQELARRIEAGDQHARQQFIECNLRLVYAIARRYLATGVGLPDLVQEGVIGLIQAVDHFDWRKGTRFSTCATLWVRQAISRALPSLRHTIKIPSRVLQELGRADAASDELQQRFQRKPSDDELADRLADELLNLDDLRRLPLRLLSLESPHDDEQRINYTDTLPDDSSPDPAGVLLQRAAQSEAMLAFRDLTDREQTVLAMRFGLGQLRQYTLGEIGDHLGLSRQRIKQIESAALLRLRKLMRDRAEQRAVA